MANQQKNTDGPAAFGGRRSVFVVLFVAAALASSGVASPGATPWRFREVRLLKDWNNAHIVTENVNKTGGTVEMNVSGEPGDICPKGSERMRFTWRFDRDITVLQPGESFGGTLEAHLIAVSNDCKGGLAWRTNALIQGSMGTTLPGPGVTVPCDGDRFQTKSSDRAKPHQEGPPSESSVIFVNSNEPYPDRKYGYFIVRIDGPGGSLCYLYVYEPGGDGAGNGPGTGTGPGTGPGSGNGNACGFSLGSGIYNKWAQTGGERGILGCATSNENEAGRSFRGTTGRYAMFKGGSIVWHRTGPRAGMAFEVNGCIGGLYGSMNGSNSWLGFPISDEYSVPGGRRSDFEGGFIQWDAKTSKCQAYRYSSSGPE